ncbi:HxlR family transcriptional regulator [Hoeflea marina]|uniref:HxlR family transcriptional regulator n=1 Tax=Hoeflea marina TaxID=274592 RepID=A0A317PUM0_9HYPH|nr:helix-turn-helix domain-containing protein [Hoeflea marina]PWW04384.1 HxlR family transcriptional regulator [Hoeflea marina]
MNTSRFAEINCSISRTLAVMGDAWTSLILRDVWFGVNRFDDLANDLGISRNLLTSRLKAMVEDDIIVAVPYQQRPVRNEYFLTTAGKELVPVLLTLVEWGERWRIEPGKSPLRVKHKGCGHYTHATVVCSECGDPLTIDNIAPELGPGATATPGTSVVVPRFS